MFKNHYSITALLKSALQQTLRQVVQYLRLYSLKRLNQFPSAAKTRDVPRELRYQFTLNIFQNPRCTETAKDEPRYAEGSLQKII